MTKASSNGKPRSATFEDLYSARSRSAEVLGLAPDGEPLTIHWIALSGEAVIEYFDREENEDLTMRQKYEINVTDLAKALVTADGKPLASKEKLLTLPADTINELMRTVAGNKAKEGDEGNVSGEAAGSASPTA